MKSWIIKAYAYLDKSLGEIPSELNEIDWKQALTPNNAKMCKSLSAFANLPGGGYLVFGINNKTANVIGINRQDATLIVDKLASL